MQCSALTVKGHPCRGYGTLCEGVRPAVALCHRHRNFFDGDKVFETVSKFSNPWQTHAEKRWLIRMASSPLFQWKPQYKETILAKFSGDSLFQRHRAAYIYDIFVRAGAISPTLIKPLWYDRVMQQLKIVQFCVLEHRTSPITIPMILDLLEPYFRGVGLRKGVIILFSLMGKTAFAEGLADPEVQVIFWKRVTDALLPRMDGQRFVGESIEAFLAELDKGHKERPRSHWHTSGVREAVEGCLRILQMEERARLKQRVGTFKEELMMNRWHPLRVQAALEAGFEPEDL